MLAASVNPTPIKPVAAMNSQSPCDMDASPNPTASVTPPASSVQRVPTHFISKAGKGLDRPQVNPSIAKLDPAADIDQFSSDAIVNRTTPSEVKVAAVTKKKNSETTANINHERCMSRSLQTGGRRVLYSGARKLARLPNRGMVPGARLPDRARYLRPDHEIAVPGARLPFRVRGRG